MSEPPELPVLELVLGGHTYKRRPDRSRRDVDPATLEQLQAAWDAADRTPARSLIRAARKKAQRRPATADDSARRVKQKQAPQQQATQRGAFSLIVCAPPVVVSLTLRPGSCFPLLCLHRVACESAARLGGCRKCRRRARDHAGVHPPAFPPLTQNTDPSISDRPAHPSTD